MLTENLGEVDPYPHAFQRDRSCTFCYVCQDLWPANNGVISNFHKCNICGVSVHTGCRNIAKKCYECNPGRNHVKFNDMQLKEYQLCGKIAIELLHGYDIPLPTGVSLNGAFRISSSNNSTIVPIVKSSISVMGDQDIVWSTGSQNISGYSNILYLTYPKDNISSNSNISYSLEVEIWKSMYTLFDSLFASSRVNLVPLLIYPNIIVERWFELKDNEKSSCGMILLRLKFVPNKDLKAIPQKANVYENINPTADLRNRVSSLPLTSSQSVSAIPTSSNISNKLLKLDLLNNSIKNEDVNGNNDHNIMITPSKMSLISPSSSSSSNKSLINTSKMSLISPSSSSSNKSLINNNNNNNNNEIHISNNFDNKNNTTIELNTTNNVNNNNDNIERDHDMDTDMDIGIGVIGRDILIQTNSKDKSNDVYNKYDDDDVNNVNRARYGVI